MGVLGAVLVVALGCEAIAPSGADPPLSRDEATATDGGDDLGGSDARPPGVPDDARPGRVDRVVDGDTLRIWFLGGATRGDDSERVRLLSIDAPELDHPERGEDCGAVDATERVAELVPPGSFVWLASDVEDRDGFGRPLRHVWSEDGTDVSATLVTEGLADARLYRPNDRFYDHLAHLEDEARDAEVGVWGELCVAPPWAAAVGSSDGPG